MIWFGLVLVIGAAMFVGSLVLENKGTVGEPNSNVLALRLSGIIVGCLGLTGAAITQAATVIPSF